jgi:magnesium-transporting ATPase (P-type)
VDGRTIGALLLADELRAETPHAIRMLRAAHVTRIVMVTGDHAAAAQTIGRRSILTRCSPTVCRPTKSMLCALSSGFIRPPWSATASTTLRHCGGECRHCHGRARRQRFFGSGGRRWRPNI